MPASHLRIRKAGLVEWCENIVEVLEKDCGLENYWIEIKVHKLEQEKKPEKEEKSEQPST
jgi:hypothetical protein